MSDKLGSLSAETHWRTDFLAYANPKYFFYTHHFVSAHRLRGRRAHAHTSTHAVSIRGDG